MKKNDEKSASQKALSVWGIILIIWAYYRAKFGLAPVWFDELVAKPLVFVLPVYWYVTRIEGKKFFPSIDLHRKRLGRNIGLGMIAGIPLITAAAYGYQIKNGSLAPLFTRTVVVNEVLLVAVMVIVTAICEEILSRGFILKRLYEESKNIYTSSFFASILFFFLYIPVLFTDPQITGNTLLLLLVTTLSLGLMNSFVFLATGSLVVPIVIHAIYSMSVMVFF